ncbi:MAG TPA: type II secretion system F family protein [Gaiellaceae bacterium]|nr:type II secretion system F family protein [Gaiellaceae bacterium]
MRRPILLAALAGLLLPALASAGVQVKAVDTSAYPTVRVSVVTDAPTVRPPKLTEDGQTPAGVSAENLGRAKSIVLAIDRSRSMRGQPLADAVAAARAFIEAKPSADRIAITTFATQAVALTGFTTATINADTALRALAVDPVEGTTLWDAIVLSARSLAGEPLPARVIILVTDGNETMSEASLADATRAAKDAGVAVYPIAIESPRFTPVPLKELAAETGGTYYGAASSEALAQIYTSIAEELKRTWQITYVTAARPGDHLTVEASTPGDKPVEAALDIPGFSPPANNSKPSPLLPEHVLQSAWGALVLGGAVGLLVLLAGLFAFAAKKGAWLSHRLDPHVGPTEAEIKRPDGRERLALASGLFRATERTFGHFRRWQRMGNLIERADLPIRTVEFVYLMGGSAFLAGFIAAVAGLPSFVILAVLAVGAFIPYLVVYVKARRRLRAFENQLPDLLVTMAASLKAGHSFRQGLQAVVEEDQEPASKEFKRVLAETRLGRPMDAALSEMARRLGSKDFEFVITAVTIQRQVGGSLAGIFDMVADTVRDRQQFQRKIRGLTAMGRMSAYTLVGLPFFVLGAITLVNSEYMAPLYHSSTGHMLLIIMLVMMAFGSLILKKIVSFRG